jgi:hypothetical protein
MMDPTDQHADVTTPDALRAGRREWIGLDLTVLHLAVPSLSAELRNSLHRSPPPKATQ